MSSALEYYCERTPPKSIKIYNVLIGSCCNLEIKPHRAIGDNICLYCKYMKAQFAFKSERKKKEPIPEEKPVEPLTDLDILDIIGETGLEIS